MPRRILGGALATALAFSALSAAPPAAHAAGDNDRSDWDDKRIGQTPGAAEGPVQVLSGGFNQWALVARNTGDDTWRLRETRGEVGSANPTYLPATVTDFVADTTSSGYAFGAYVADGGVYSFRRAKQGRDVSAGAPFTTDQGGETVVDAGNTADALVAHGGTWRQFIGSRQSGIGGTGDTWVTYPDPNVDGLPGAAGQRFGFTGADLIAFWNEPNGDLRAARRPLLDPAAAFSAPQSIATGGEKVVRFVETSVGPSLITQAPDGAVSLRAYMSDGAGYTFGKPTQLAGPVTAGEPVTEPQVALSLGGIVTVGWEERGVDGRGLVLWQQDRPLSTYLERPTLVPGTRDANARVVTSPRGSLTVALRRDDEDASVRVKHLPAGKKKWTDGTRLVSPKPSATSTSWAIGTPTYNQDLRVAVNDRVGVYGFRFDAPRAYTTMVKPVRKVQSAKTYRIGWNTSWSFADDWMVRARVDKGRTYGPWKFVSTDDGVKSKVVTRPRGSTYCYQARGLLNEVHVTRWSAQRCVTVRR